MSFRMAGSIGFQEAMAKAGPILLEPISTLTVTVPEVNQGDVMGDLNSKRGASRARRRSATARSRSARRCRRRRSCATRSTCAR